MHAIPRTLCALAPLSLLPAVASAQDAMPTREEMWELIRQQQAVIEQLQEQVRRNDARIEETREQTARKPTSRWKPPATSSKRP